MSDSPNNKPAPQGVFGPPVPSHFLSSQTQDSMQPLALVKRVGSSSSSSTSAPASSHTSLVHTLPTSSQQGLHVIPSSQTLPQQMMQEGVGNPMNPKVIVTTRTPIFIKSSVHMSPLPRHSVVAHTQSTQSIVGGKISAAVRPSQVMNPQPIPQTMVRVPATSPRVPQIRPGLQLRQIYPSPRIPMQRSPTASPPNLPPYGTPPPHRSPKLKSPPVTPPVAHMVNRTVPMSVRPPLQQSPFPAHTGRRLPGPKVRSPPSTQQVRPIIVNTANTPLIRNGPVLTIPGNPPRIQATLTGIPLHNSQVTFSSPNGQMLVTQSKPSPSSIPSSTQLSPSNARPVIFASRHLLPANFKGPTLPYAGLSKQKVLVAVGPQGLKQSPTVKIQAKPSTSVQGTNPVRGSVAPLVVANQSQILVPIQPSPVRKPYTGRKRGRKPGSKNKPKTGTPLKVKIRPTTIVHGVTQKSPTPREGSQSSSTPVSRESTASAPQETAPQADSEPPQSENEKDVPQNLQVREGGSEKLATEIPRAVVKPQILTHVIDGFIIEESKDPFPMPENGSLPLAMNADGSRTAVETRGVKRGASESWDASPDFLRCEFCGKMDFPRKFKRSKRFCSMACAKRYNVGCTKRLGLFAPKEEKPERIKHKMKVQGPKAKPLKGARGKYGRLKFNVTQPWNSRAKIVYQAIGGVAEGTPSTTSEESHSTSSSNTTVSPIVSESDSMPFPDESEELPPGLPIDPSNWSVTDVRDFITSVPGCNDFAEEFHSQEIDGQALMLLKEDHLMTTMNMKLGPALKIISKINSLREKQTQ
ncbi:Polyhomeotic-like protein 2 [Holothuria leucospilota]|uniref:Polyhomeotic-like protein 2 n=1 Tax=Holothuria leucospilota TaxID=206669 RepID=A0A9Q1BB57_HOLLE|nr:Polyhomeotic-like protein 2 [Holothuria leucospilota]